jgi:hypothetical protein
MKAAQYFALLAFAVTAGAATCPSGKPMPMPPLYYPRGGVDARPIPPGYVERVYKLQDTPSGNAQRIFAHPGNFWQGAKNYRVLMPAAESDAMLERDCRHRACGPREGCK